MGRGAEDVKEPDARGKIRAAAATCSDRIVDVHCRATVTSLLPQQRQNQCDGLPSRTNIPKPSRTGAISPSPHSWQYPSAAMTDSMISWGKEERKSCASDEAITTSGQAKSHIVFSCRWQRLLKCGDFNASKYAHRHALCQGVEISTIAQRCGFM